MTIKNRLLIIFSAIVGVMMIPLSYIFFSQQIIIDQYSQSVDNLLNIRQIIDLHQELIDTYKEQTQNPDSQQLAATFSQQQAELDALLMTVEDNVFAENSPTLLTTVHNAIDNSNKAMEEGVTAIENQDFSTATEKYNIIFTDQVFIKNATVRLLVEELNSTILFREQIAAIKRNISVLALIATTTAIIVSILFSVIQADQIIDPILRLVSTTESVAEKNFDTAIDQDLTQRGDEIGKLAASFDQMLGQIQSHMTQLNDSFKELETTKEELKKNNQELKKINKFMVGRELKMEEMKKKVSELEAQING
jgi:nitrogen fixation/metabolism regulation signal transduction histidine kinase